MKMPWVSRAAYEAQRSWFLREREDNAHAQLEWSKRYDALLEKYQALKLQGAVAVPPITKIEPKPQSMVSAAIQARAMKVAPAARRAAVKAMTDWAQQQAHGGASEQEVVFGLERGVEVQSVEDVVT